MKFHGLSAFAGATASNLHTKPVDAVTSIPKLRITNQGFSDTMSEVFPTLRDIRRQPEALRRMPN
jgi:hypothetical protein